VLKNQVGSLMNHSVSDLVCLLKNGQAARKPRVVTPFSRLKHSILNVLKDNGYIKGVEVVKGESFDTLVVDLAYYNSRPVIKTIEVISKPGKRKYSKVKAIPVIASGLGTVILTTSRGVMSGVEAKNANIAGELLLKIF